MNDLTAMLDVSFALTGDALPRDHRRALAASIDQVLPWLAGLQGAGVHRLNVSAGAGPLALLSNRTRLTLRLPRERAADAASLAGQTLPVVSACLHVGAPQARELLPWGTLYAHLVAAEDGCDELGFLDAVGAELQALGVRARAICGRRQVLLDDGLQGFSLMLDGLGEQDSLRILETGIGRHRRLGCGLFVPHKSAAAVGTPP